jgi:hypothetical protein
MKFINLKTKLITASVMCAGVMLMSNQALAAGTTSGTTISNTANLTYSSGGVSQPTVASTSASFVVDTKVNMTLVAQATYTTVVPGSTSQVTTFTLTNTGNSTNDFLLTPNGALASGTTVYSKTDNFDATSCAAYADTAGTGVYNATTDTQTYVDELAPDTTIKVFEVCSIPSTRVNGDFAADSLIVQAAQGGTPGSQGAALVATTGAKSLTTVAIVFGDAAGTDDAANDGKISARSGFLVQTASLTVTKTVTPYCDPVNFSNNPKLVPGSYAQYNITISNAAGAGGAATLGAVTDTLVSQLAFDPNLIKPTTSSCSAPEKAAGSGLKIACTGGSRACVTTPIYVTTTSVVTGQNLNANLGTLLPAEGSYSAGQLNAGESVNVIFNAVVQ